MAARLEGVAGRRGGFPRLDESQCGSRLVLAAHDPL